MSVSQFEFLGLSHIAAMGVTLAVPILLTIAVKRLNSAKATQAVCGAFAGLLLLNEILPWGHRVAMVGAYEFARWYLPLHVCSITVFAVAAALHLSLPDGVRNRLLLGTRRRDQCRRHAAARGRLSSVSLLSIFHCPRRHRRRRVVRNLGPRHETDGQGPSFAPSRCSISWLLSRSASIGRWGATTCSSAGRPLPNRRFSLPRGRGISQSSTAWRSFYFMCYSYLLRSGAG